jgi:TRAP-type mannitol/chloroaromatic compound transport system permease small subunit
MEISPDPGGLPRYPLKAVIPLTFVLLIFQGFSEVIKSLAVIRGVSLTAGEDDNSTGGHGG